jgi:photosystem II oxygen-evolving enhancer protein 2
MMTKGSTIALVCTLLSGADALSPNMMSRRQSLQAVVGGVATAVVPSVVSLLPAFAEDEEAPAATTTAEEEAPPPPPKPKYVAQIDEETPRTLTRMGGLLEPFQDGLRSIKMMVPSGWNKFEGEVGAYDIKWQDLVDQTSNIKISSTPVKSTTTSIDVLGEVNEVGAGLASKRNAKLMSATARLTDGVLFYKFDFAINDGTHQLLQLCICKGKLWSIDANSKVSQPRLSSNIPRRVNGSRINHENLVFCLSSPFDVLNSQLFCFFQTFVFQHNL